MTVPAKATKTLWQGADEGEQCRPASSGDFLVGVDSAKAGTVVKVTETGMSEAETVKHYADHYMKDWHMDEATAISEAKEDIKMMTFFANHFELGQNLHVKITKAGRVSVTEL
jgi:hypothetical protein